MASRFTMQDHSTFWVTRRTVLAKLICYLLTIASAQPQIQLGNAVWRTAKNPRLMLYVQIIHGLWLPACCSRPYRQTDRLLCEAIKINCPNKTRNRNKQNNSHRQTKLCVARIWANSFYLYTYLCVYTYLYICKNLRTYLANSMPKAKNELAIFGWKMKTIKNIIN